jgi:hypothetical protein
MFELLMEHRDLSPDELAKVFGSLLGGATTANNNGASSPKVRRASTASAKPAAKTSSRAAAPNLRSDAGRSAYDESVLSAFASLGGKNVQARKLRVKVGGTPQQLRAALDRLIEAKRLTFSGERAGTRYSLR